MIRSDFRWNGSDTNTSSSKYQHQHRRFHAVTVKLNLPCCATTSLEIAIAIGDCFTTCDKRKPQVA